MVPCLPSKALVGLRNPRHFDRPLEETQENPTMSPIALNLVTWDLLFKKWHQEMLAYVFLLFFWWFSVDDFVSAAFLMSNLSFCVTKSNHIKYLILFCCAPICFASSSLETRPPNLFPELLWQCSHLPQGDIAWSGEKISFPKIGITLKCNFGYFRKKSFQK